MKYLIGSKLIGLANNKDTDYLVLIEGNTRRIYKDGQDTLYISKAAILERMHFKLDFRQNARNLLFNYQLDKDIIGQNFPIDYHLLEYKKKLIELLKLIVREELLNFNNRVSTNNGHCSKIIYHIAYNVFILQNNSSIITAEQREIIQKIHDRQMPIKYLDYLREVIEKF